MTQFFINKNYIKDESVAQPTDLVVSGRLVDENVIELSMTNQRSFKNETWTDAASNYVPVEYVKYQGYMILN